MKLEQNLRNRKKQKEIEFARGNAKAKSQIDSNFAVCLYLLECAIQYQTCMCNLSKVSK